MVPKHVINSAPTAICYLGDGSVVWQNPADDAQSIDFDTILIRLWSKAELMD
jgi:hypothetical protein